MRRRDKMTEDQIAVQLNVDQSTIARDIQAIKEEDLKFVFDLAKKDLAHFYKNCLDSVGDASKEIWEMVNNNKATGQPIDKDRLAALKTIVDCELAGFKILSEGPTVLLYNSFEDRVSALLEKQSNKNRT
jgi:hypothetical protein